MELDLNTIEPRIIPWAIAQRLERSPDKTEVEGSIPSSPTISFRS